MAKITDTRIEEVEVVTVKKVPTVTLQLTEEEAETLLLISAKIGGNPTRSRRRHVDSIGKALKGHFGYDGVEALRSIENRTGTRPIGFSTGIQFEIED